MNDSHHGEQILGSYELVALEGHSRGEVQTFWFLEIRWFHLFLKRTYINIQLDHFHILGSKTTKWSNLKSETIDNKYL